MEAPGWNQLVIAQLLCAFKKLDVHYYRFRYLGVKFIDSMDILLIDMNYILDWDIK